MSPALKVKSENTDAWLNRLIEALCEFRCEQYFPGHLGRSQHEQKEIISRFQDSLSKSLTASDLGVSWQLEYVPVDDQRDSIDIYGECEDFVVAIELDKSRADQVAKKFVSRMALMSNKKIYYVSLCYPGTERMSLNEYIKYFGYCANLAPRMGGIYAGIIIQ